MSEVHYEFIPGGGTAELDAHKDLTTGCHGVGTNHICEAPTSGHLVRSFSKGFASEKVMRGAGVDTDPDEIFAGSPLASARARRTLVVDRVVHVFGKRRHLRVALRPVSYLQRNRNANFITKRSIKIMFQIV